MAPLANPGHLKKLVKCSALRAMSLANAPPLVPTMMVKCPAPQTPVHQTNIQKYQLQFLNMCAMLAQLITSLTASYEGPGFDSRLGHGIEHLGDLPSLHRPWTGT